MNQRLLGPVEVTFCRILLIAVSWLVTGIGWAQESNPGDDADAFRRGSHSVWVDPKTESVRYEEEQLRRTDVSDRHDSIRQPSSSKSLWERLFGAPGERSETWEWLTELFQGFFDVWRFALFVGLAILLIVVLSFIFGRSRFSIRRGRSNTLSLQEDLESQRARMSDLPFELEHSEIGLRAQADRYRAAGDYSRAIVYLFSYVLVELDRHERIRLERGNTNGYYVRSLRSHAFLYPFMLRLVQTFESVFFGRYALSGEQFDALWNQLDTFHDALLHAPDSKALPGPNRSTTVATTAATTAVSGVGQ